MFIGKLIIIFGLTSLPLGATSATATAKSSSSSSSSSSQPQAAEYCLNDSFNVTCPFNHVILMTSARYGRMRSGKCINLSYGHVGCSTDVTSRIEEECSARQGCLFPVTKLLDVNACPKDLTSYLEVTYRCVPVAESQCRSYAGPDNVSPVSLQAQNPQSGRLVLYRHPPRCPWKFIADPTQKIKFTLYTFAASKQSVEMISNPVSSVIKPASQTSNRACPWTVVFREPDLEPRSFETDVCILKSRETLLYSSKKNVVLVQATHNKHYNFNFNDVTPHLIKFETVGCPMVRVPKNAWAVQDEVKATVRCNFTDETWSLACNGNDWNGEIGNCSKSSVSIMLESSLTRYNPLPIGFISAVVIGVVLGIVIGSVPLALVYLCLRRKWREQQEVELHHQALRHQQAAGLYSRDSTAAYYTEEQHCLPLSNSSKDYCRSCPIIHTNKPKLHTATMVNKILADDQTMRDLVYSRVPTANSTPAGSNNNRMQLTDNFSESLPVSACNAFKCCSTEWLERPDVASISAGNESFSPILPKSRTNFENSNVLLFSTLSKSSSGTGAAGQRYDVSSHQVA